MAAASRRDDALDSSNSLEDGQDPPHLDFWDLSLNAGGPILPDRVFMFASAEGIEEDRQLNFSFPPATPQSVRAFENEFDQPTHHEQTRLFAKFDEQIGDRHRLTQSGSYIEADIADFLPLSMATSLPSTRRTFDRERTMIGLRDTSIFGDGSNPWVFDGFLQYRDDSDADLPAHPEAGPFTGFSVFSSTSTFGFFGDLGSVAFGSSTTESLVDQEYGALGSSLVRSLQRHDLKGGVDFLRTEVDGHELAIVTNQLFATEENFNEYGPIYAGFFSLTTAGPLTPEAGQIRLRNDYGGLYLQDDWKVTERLVVNLGLRWDRDSEFEDDDNLAPRVGFAWSVTDKTVVRGSAGLYYDRFRLGLVRDVPDFGGADLRLIQPLSYPQLFENVTTSIPVVFGLCINPVLTNAQIAASGAPCPFGPLPHYGRDHLSNLVAPGRSPIAPETVVTIDNVQQLTGLTPDEYLARVTGAVPLLPGFSWFWGPFGALSHTGLPASQFPVTLDPSFETPHSEAYHLGVEHQIGRDWLLALDLHHREIKDMLGLRVTNLAFISRIPGNELTFEGPITSSFVNGFGPWYEGEVDAATVSIEKRMRDRWAFTAHYTYNDAEDNARIAQLGDANLATGGPGLPVRQFRRHAAGRLRPDHRSEQRERPLRGRQRQLRPSGRQVLQRSRPRQGAIESGDRAHLRPLRPGAAAARLRARGDLPPAERLPLQPRQRDGPRRRRQLELQHSRLRLRAQRRGGSRLHQPGPAGGVELRSRSRPRHSLARLLQPHQRAEPGCGRGDPGPDGGLRRAASGVAGTRGAARRPIRVRRILGAVMSTESFPVRGRRGHVARGLVGRRRRSARPSTSRSPAPPPSPSSKARGCAAAEDLEAFFDGVMAAHLQAQRIVGATVSVVKDGELFFAKGYGHADLEQRRAGRSGADAVSRRARPASSSPGPRSCS